MSGIVTDTLDYSTAGSICYSYEEAGNKVQRETSSQEKAEERQPETKAS